MIIGIIGNRYKVLRVVTCGEWDWDVGRGG